MADRLLAGAMQRGDAMTRTLFGTDGIRGRANTHPMTAELALRLGAAAGRFFRRDDSAPHRVVIGKDTRLSGYMLENALTAGFTSTGMNVLLLGPAPTPAVGLLTRSMRADVGVMISASHNPAEDNGIKFFGPDGFKLSGLRVVLDCANGASYRAAPEVLWELGAEVVAMGVSPDGRNINDGVGSTATEAAAARIREIRADVGICLDGDADRVILLDETGAQADGDQIMALLAERWAAEDRLKDGTLVATVMSNLGLERFLKGKGLSLHRTAVGDRYVVEAMRQGGWNLGGEQSGHIVMTDYATTGDGLMAALQFLAEMVRTGQPASALARRFERVPQILKNVRYTAGTEPLGDPAVKAAIAEGEASLNGTGRVLIRKSGTEPLIRVMAEAEDEALMGRIVDEIVEAMRKAG